ncbi:MAG: alpha/beta hydrolase [Burkholderiaceae bacterium]|nr:alpha/beta hydrolase [Burkholderiaceae bacterium]
MSLEQLDIIKCGFRDLYAGWGAGVGIAQMRREWDAFLTLTRIDAAAQDVDADGVRCRWIRAAAAREDRTILYLHGGGYQIGSTDSHFNAMAALSLHTGCRVLGVDYRLAPEHKFPAAVDDAFAAWCWLTQQGVDAKHIALCGDSAGGGLIIALMALLRERSMAQPAAAVAMSPWVDMEAGDASFSRNAQRDPVTQRQNLLLMARAYLGRSGNPRDPLASPVHANLAGLPPLLVQVGSDEVLYGDAVQLTQRAIAQGVEARLAVWPDMIHTFQLFVGRLDEADQALREAADFLHKEMNMGTRQ